MIVQVRTLGHRQQKMIQSKRVRARGFELKFPPPFGSIRRICRWFGNGLGRGGAGQQKQQNEDRATEYWVTRAFMRTHFDASRAGHVREEMYHSRIVRTLAAEDLRGAG